MGSKLSFCLVLLLLLTGHSGLNWQAHGDSLGTKKNIDWTLITNFIQASISAGATVNNFPKVLSDMFNTDYDQAWNVVGVDSTANGDSVVYGYAFMGHWFWANGIIFRQGYYTGLIVWKDYNCDPSDWMTITTSSSASSMESTLLQEVSSYTSNFARSQSIAGDIWKTADLYITSIGQAQPKMLAINRGFTLIVSSVNSDYGARVCVKGYFMTPMLQYFTTGRLGRVMVLQMRNAIS